MKNNSNENVIKCKGMELMSTIQSKRKAWKLTGNNLVYALGCILMMIAAFLPYVCSDENNLSLMDGTDGIFFLMLAVLIFIFISFEKNKTVGILGIVLTYCGTYELVHTLGVIGNSGQVIAVRTGFYVLLAGTLIILVASSYFVYRNGLKNLINRVFDRFFPAKEVKEQ